ncbi:glycosyltransferase family 4 protein [Gottfriedia sp. S16(2024)]|uniref:glycosyltransferase family 4 protein n=1 Tax=Gottfriedia sp. S16(2024) TaxID=3162883 RepID=UPI003D240ACB
MKKILYITTLSRTINAFLVPHIKKLISDKNIVDCACSVDLEIERSLTEQGVNIYDIPFSRNPFHPSNLKAFRQLIKIQAEHKYDIVHVHTPIAALYGRLLKAKFPQLKTVYTVHGFHFYKGAPVTNWCIYYPIEKIMGYFTDTIITMNTEDFQRAQKFNINRILKVHGVGVDFASYNMDLFHKDEIRRKLNLSKDDFVILMIAEVNQNKNHRQMIDAVDILKNRGIQVNVVCAGDGPLKEELKEVVRIRGLEENIQFLGFRNDISELIAACDIGILLSHREGLPRNIMELMACKKTVIGTNIRGIRDLIENNVNGFLVPTNEPTVTADRIEQLIKDRVLLEQMASNANHFIKKYDVNQVVSSIAKSYAL